MSLLSLRSAKPAGAATGPEVLVYGDSLVAQAHDYINFQLHLDGYDPITQDFPGTALCDYMQTIIDNAAVARPAMVVIEFSGNNFTPCTAGITTPAEIAAKYQADANYVVSRLSSMGIPVVFVSSPPRIVPTRSPPPSFSPPTEVGQIPTGWAPVSATLDSTYQSVVQSWRAQGADVGFVDAGAAVATAARGWTYALPCLSFEGAAMGCANGLIAVRAADYTHFCPGTLGGPNGWAPHCSTWESGAWRYAAAITGYVNFRLTHSIMGSFDGVDGSGGGIIVGGWAWDTGGDQDPSQVVVYVDRSPTTLYANQTNNNVANVFPLAGSNHGFYATLPAAPGPHQICVTALGQFGRDRGQRLLLGCKSVVVPNWAPVGQLQVDAVVAGGVHVDGWTYDPDQPTAPLEVNLMVDGSLVTATSANIARPDVAALDLNTGNAHGFDMTVPITAGSHMVCATAVNIGSGVSDTQLGCQQLTVGVTPLAILPTAPATTTTTTPTAPATTTTTTPTAPATTTTTTPTAATATPSSAPAPTVPMEVVAPSVSAISSASAWWALDVTWSTPVGTDAGSSLVDNYRVGVFDVSANTLVGVQTINSTSTSYTFTPSTQVPLLLDHLYRFYVQAQNAAGWSTTVNYSGAAQALTATLYPGMGIANGQYIAGGCAMLSVGYGSMLVSNTCGGSGRWAHWAPLVDHLAMVYNGDLATFSASGAGNWDTAWSGTCLAGWGQFVTLYAPNAMNSYLFFWNAPGTVLTCALGG
jgi:hypothetical protein